MRPDYAPTPRRRHEVWDFAPSGDGDDVVRQHASELIEAALGEGNLVVVVGSGVSQFGPSSIPSATEVTGRLRTLLIDTLDPTRRHAALTLTDGMPFEIVFGRLRELNDQLARRAVAALASLSSPNPIHRQVAHLLSRAQTANVRCTVVTSNYDLGISLAWGNEDGVVDGPDHVGHLAQELFYIHGRADRPASLVLDHQAEFSIEDWKVQHLLDRVKGATVLILGFSGGDLDIATALAAAMPRDVIWIRSSRRSSNPESWTFAAQDLLGAASRRQIVINASSRFGDVLRDATFPISIDRDPVAESGRIESAIALVASENARWVSMWAKWLVLRAGLGDVARLSPEEADLLAPTAAAQFQAFGLYYQAKYRAAARVEAEAARARTVDRATYLSLRTLEAEFWNRGGYSARAVGAIALGLLGCLRRRPAPRLSEPALRGGARDLVATLAVVWPLPGLYTMRGPLPRAFRSLVAGATASLQGHAFDKQMVLAARTPPGSHEFDRARERYGWLGQRARLINPFRVEAVYVLGDRHGTANTPRIRRQLSAAVRWSRLAGDPMRLGRSRLVRLEVLRRAGRVSDSTVRAEIRRAWDDVSRAEVSAIYRVTVHGLFMLAGRVPRRLRARVRLLSMQLMETS